MSEEISENLSGANILDKNRLVPGYEVRIIIILGILFNFVFFVILELFSGC